MGPAPLVARAGTECMEGVSLHKMTATGSPILDLHTRSAVSSKTAARTAARQPAMAAVVAARRSRRPSVGGTDDMARITANKARARVRPTFSAARFCPLQPQEATGEVQQRGRGRGRSASASSCGGGRSCSLADSHRS